MKHYPTIPKTIVYDVDVHVFDKLDGSNIRAEWSPKKGFYKFGSRKQLIDEATFLGKSIDLIKSHEQAFAKILGATKTEKATCYFEFFGPRSFAGDHDPADAHEIVLLDVELYKRGFMPSADYLKAFQGSIPLPNVLHYGKVSPELVDQIKNGTLPGITFEGVVCKAPAINRWLPPYMFKIKTQAWIDKVYEKHGEFAETLLEKL